MKSRDQHAQKMLETSSDALALLVAAAEGNLAEVKRLIGIEQVDVNVAGQIDNDFLNADDVYPETHIWCREIDRHFN